MKRILIEVRGGVVEHVCTNAEDVQIYIYDHDEASAIPTGKRTPLTGWLYYEDQDRILSDKEFEVYLEKLSSRDNERLETTG